MISQNYTQKNMKIVTNFDKEEGIFILPNIIIGYKHEDRELIFMFMFACWAFSIVFAFKQQLIAQIDFQ